MPAASALDRLTAWGPLMVAALLVLLLGVILSRLTWTLLSPDLPEPPMMTVSAPADASATQTSERRQRLASLAPFGTVTDEAADRSITDSTLKIGLRGLVTGPTPLAMIEGLEGVEVLQTGDSIRDGVTIHAIDGERMVVNHEGRLEAISLPKTEQLELDQTPASESQGSSESPLKPLQADPRQFLDHVNMSAAMRGSRVIGYRVHSRPGRDGLLSRLGLHEGDMITHLDDAPLADPGNLEQLMGRLGSGEPVRIRVERSGEPIEITIETGAL